MTKEEAIKILENMPIPPTDDYSFNDISDALYIAIEALQAPPISQRKMYQAGYKQAQEDKPKGKWKKATESIWKCNLCNAIMFTDSNYCPNCGAKMDGERSE